jgi:hypothetical protein
MQVPNNHVFTVYSVVGELFGWLAVVGFVTIVILAILQGRKAGTAAAVAPESTSPSV